MPALLPQSCRVVHKQVALLPPRCLVKRAVLPSARLCRSLPSTSTDRHAEATNRRSNKRCRTIPALPGLEVRSRTTLSADERDMRWYHPHI